MEPATTEAADLADLALVEARGPTAAELEAEGQANMFGEAPAAKAAEKPDFPKDMEVRDGRLTFKDAVDTDAPDPVDGSQSRVGIAFEESSDGIQIKGSYLNSVDRGQGKGLALYKALADYAAARGLPVFSDFDVSEAAYKIYEKLEALGYAVTRSTDFRKGDDAGYAGKYIGGMNADGNSTDGFTLRIDPTKSEPGADGKPQSLIPGVGPVSDKARAELAAGKPMRGGDAAGGGLFDADARAQADLVDLIPAGTDSEGKPLYTTHADLVAEAARDNDLADLIASCKD